MQIFETVTTRTFIIVEPDPIISMDLVGVVTTAFPQCRVSVNHVFSDALDQIAAASVATTILLGARTVSGAMIDVLRKCVTGGAQVVFVGKTTEIDFPAASVEMPFTTDMIVDVLSR